MILNDKEIAGLASYRQMIEPFSEANLNGFGYDITLASEFRILAPTLFQDIMGAKEVMVLDPMSIKEEHFEYVMKDRFVIPPGSFVLGRSKEFFVMPDDVIGFCFGRSSYARCGIVVNPTPLEPGWQGTLTIEISNSGPLPMIVHANKRIMQVVFHRGEMPGRTYTGKYQGQVSVTLSKGIGE